MKLLARLLLLLILSACSTHQLKRSNSAKLASYGKNIKLLVSAEDKQIADQLSRYLQANLLIAGFNPVSDEAATRLDVVVSEFSPGNQALRITVGFGAGRGSLVYNAKYRKDGTVLIDYDGAERFTGLEIAPGTKSTPFRQLGDAETATEVLMEEASKHIVDLAKD